MDPASTPLHLAARIEDAVQRFRERRGRRRGLVPTIVPFTGYGGTGWVRVLGRVMLRKPEDTTGPSADRLTSIRGWRSFTSVHVANAKVTVSVGRAKRQITADRGGVLDDRIEVKLPPGWHDIRLSIDGYDAVDAQVFVVADDIEFGLVSDIDDTVMVTALPRPFLAAWNTFVLDEHARTPVCRSSTCRRARGTRCRR